jgi:hypothetical protein
MAVVTLLMGVQWVLLWWSAATTTGWVRLLC